MDAVPQQPQQPQQFQEELAALRAEIRAELQALREEQRWFSKEDVTWFLRLALSFCGFTSGSAHEKLA